MSAPENREAFTGLGPLKFPQPTMTMRDWLAGQAISGLLANKPWMDQVSTALQLVGDTHDGAFQTTAAMAAYEYADAMLAEREKGGAA